VFVSVCVCMCVCVCERERKIRVTQRFISYYLLFVGHECIRELKVTRSKNACDGIKDAHCHRTSGRVQSPMFSFEWHFQSYELGRMVERQKKRKNVVKKH